MILEIDKLKFNYRINTIIEDIDLKIDEHELVAVMGPNGAGKTTLIKCINSILKPSSGSIMIHKENLLNMDQLKIAQKIGYVAQKSETCRITVFDAIMLGRYPYIKWGISKNDLKIVNSIIHTLHLDNIALRFIDELSGGELQKVSTARALVQEPDILLLDEPTSNLDLKNQIEIMELIKKVVVKHKVAAIISMHDINMALRYCDRFMFLKDRTVFSFCKQNEITETMIEHVYGLPVTIKYFDDIPFVIPKGEF